MKATKALSLALLLLSTLLYSQNTFKLGITGAYPNAYGYTVNSGINWSFYNELKFNTWQGWWAGDTNTHLVNLLASNNIKGYFQPDTLRWAGYGRMQT